MTVNIYRPTAEDGLSLAELALYHDIIAYRAEHRPAGAAAVARADHHRRPARRSTPARTSGPTG